MKTTPDTINQVTLKGRLAAPAEKVESFTIHALRLLIAVDGQTIPVTARFPWVKSNDTVAKLYERVSNLVPGSGLVIEGQLIRGEDGGLEVRTNALTIGG